MCENISVLLNNHIQFLTYAQLIVMVGSLRSIMSYNDWLIIVYRQLLNQELARNIRFCIAYWLYILCYKYILKKKVHYTFIVIILFYMNMILCQFSVVLFFTFLLHFVFVINIFFLIYIKMSVEFKYSVACDFHQNFKIMWIKSLGLGLLERILKT